MTAVRYEPERWKLSLTGHAGAGRFGEDLVCAALSALWNTLERALTRDGETVERLRPVIVLGDGCRSAECDPEPEAETECALLLGVFAEGLRLLAEDFPEYVGFIEG